MGVFKIRNQLILLVIIVTIAIAGTIYDAFDINRLAYLTVAYTVAACLVIGSKLFFIVNRKLFPKCSLSYFSGILKDEFTE